MEIISKLIEIETKLPTDNVFIEKRLNEMGIFPLRWAIVNVDCNKLIINVAYENL